MVDDVKNITENAESKVSAEALDRARLARERREAEQRKRLDELRAHAAAAQAQRERRDEERRRRQSEQRNRDDDRRTQVEERKRAIWEASISRREALLQREREREERLERARASRSTPRSAFAFGSSTPRLLEPVDTTGFFWAARRASSTTNVMFASAPLTRRASALHLDSDNDPKDEPDRQPPPAMWSSVARRRTDLVPTLPASRGPGRAYSMTRLDRIPSARPLHAGSPSMHHLNRTQTRSGDSTPGSRPGSALSNATTVVRRATSAPRRPRPASIAGTGVNTPRGGGDQGQSVATTPGVSRDGSSTNMGGGGDVPRRHPSSTPRRVRPMSVHDPSIHVPMTSSGGVTDGKPPLHRKPKLSKDHEKTPRGKSLSVSPGRLSASLSPAVSKESSVDKEVKPKPSSIRNLVNPTEVSQKLEALQIKDADTAKEEKQSVDLKVNENKEPIVNKPSSPIEQANVTQENTQDVPKTMENGEKPVLPEKPVVADKPVLPEKPVEKVDKKEERKTEKVEEKRDTSAEKNDESEMTASMSAKRITTEEEAKAALAERRKKAREELEKQAELERQRLQREAEEEEERQRQEEERQRREEEEARELARLQRSMEEDKLRKAIEAQQQLEREEAERKAQEEIDKQTRLREEEEKRKALEEELRQKREEAEREEKERLARKQRVEAIMARTRLKKAEEDKKQDIKPQSSPAPSQAESQTPVAPAASDDPVPINGNEKVNNGNAGNVADLLGFGSSEHSEEPKGLLDASITASESNSSASLESNPAPNNGNVTADLPGLSEQNNTEDKPQEQMIANIKPQIDNTTTNVQPALETNNGNLHSVPSPTSNVGHISANFIQTERLSAEQSKDKSKFNEEDFTSHNGHNATLNHPLTLQNAI